eukprot:SAG31_NODE_4522_length_3168_cov_6.962529_3_plen_345_part_00
MRELQHRVQKPTHRRRMQYLRHRLHKDRRSLRCVSHSHQSLRAIAGGGAVRVVAALLRFCDEGRDAVGWGAAVKLCSGCLHGTPAHGTACPTAGGTTCGSCTTTAYTLSNGLCGAYCAYASHARQCCLFRCCARLRCLRVSTRWLRGRSELVHRVPARYWGNRRYLPDARWRHMRDLQRRVQKPTHRRRMQYLRHRLHNVRRSLRCVSHSHQSLRAIAGGGAVRVVAVLLRFCDEGRDAVGCGAAVNSCTGCQHGTPAIGTACPTPSGTTCASCTTGYKNPPTAGACSTCASGYTITKSGPDCGACHIHTRACARSWVAVLSASLLRCCGFVMRVAMRWGVGPQ